VQLPQRRCSLAWRHTAQPLPKTPVITPSICPTARTPSLQGSTHTNRCRVPSKANPFAEGMALCGFARSASRRGIRGNWFGSKSNGTPSVRASNVDEASQDRICPIGFRGRALLGNRQRRPIGCVHRMHLIGNATAGQRGSATVQAWKSSREAASSAHARDNSRRRRAGRNKRPPDHRPGRDAHARRQAVRLCFGRNRHRRHSNSGARHPRYARATDEHADRSLMARPPNRNIRGSEGNDLVLQIFGGDRLKIISDEIQ
jgi:hypothetical protein